MRESEWTRKVCKEMERAGAKIFPIVGGPMQAPGWPDRLVCDRTMYLVEFKGEHTAITKLQKTIMGELNKRGKHAFVARYPGVLSLDGEVVGEFANGLQLLELVREIKSF